MAVAISWRSNAQATSLSSTSNTFTSQDIGTAAADRLVAVSVGWLTSPGDSIVPTVTVGGASAAAAVTKVGTTDTNIGEGIYWVLVTSGTTANVVVSKTGNTFNRMGIGIWAVTGASTTTPIVSSASQEGTSASPSVTINESANGGAIAASWSQGNGGAMSISSWSGVTASFSSVGFQGFSSNAGASTTYSGATPGATITANWSGAQEQEVLVAASFQVPVVAVANGGFLSFM